MTADGDGPAIGLQVTFDAEDVRCVTLHDPEGNELCVS